MILRRPRPLSLDSCFLYLNKIYYHFDFSTGIRLYNKLQNFTQKLPVTSTFFRLKQFFINSAPQSGEVEHK